MKCKVCNKKSVVPHPIYGVVPCIDCQNRQSGYATKQQPEFINLSRKERIDPQRDQFGADMIQPFLADGSPDPAFAKTYPDRVDDYFSKDQLSRLDV